MRRPVALDPGTVWHGFAWRTPAGLWRCGRARLDGLQAVLEEALGDGCNVAVVEDVFLGRDLAVFKRLCVLQGRILALCGALGLVVELVAPIRWKLSMLTVDGALPEGRLAQKAAAVEVARRLGAAVEDDDGADAVCLAEYASRGGRPMPIGQGSVAATRTTLRVLESP